MEEQAILPVESGLWKDRYEEMGASLDQMYEEYAKVFEKYVAAEAAA